MQKVIENFEEAIETAADRLRHIPDADAGLKPMPDKWSAKEILGHLIDSSINNHRRFVLAQLKEDLIFEGYDQESWVRTQKYHDMSWRFLVEVWTIHNRHLLHLIRVIPGSVLSRKHNNHNYDEIAWRRVKKENAVTLEYLIRDYIGHMQHHLNQIYLVAKNGDVSVNVT